MDASPPDGDGLGMSPRAALLAALAGCTAMDVTSILRKKRQRVERYEIAVAGDEATEYPQVFTAIRVEHRFHGDADPEAIRRSVELSATRYCPVSALLSRGVEIEHRYRLTRPDGSGGGRPRGGHRSRGLAARLTPSRRGLECGLSARRARRPLMRRDAAPSAARPLPARRG